MLPLAGQIQHMAAQNVGFTPRPIGSGPPNLHVSRSAAIRTILGLSVPPLILLIRYSISQSRDPHHQRV